MTILVFSNVDLRFFILHPLTLRSFVPGPFFLVLFWRGAYVELLVKFGWINLLFNVILFDGALNKRVQDNEHGLHMNRVAVLVTKQLRKKNRVYESTFP